MNVKVMKASANGKGRLFKRLQIAANTSGAVTFSSSGTYFTKTEAKINGRPPIFKKGLSFIVHNDASGYSVLTLTFSITESSLPQSTGQTISQSEFEAD
jgi:hypothetical protein